MNDIPLTRQDVHVFYRGRFCVAGRPLSFVSGHLEQYRQQHYLRWCLGSYRNPTTISAGTQHCAVIDRGLPCSQVYLGTPKAEEKCKVLAWYLHPIFPKGGISPRPQPLNASCKRTFISWSSRASSEGWYSAASTIVTSSSPVEGSSCTGAMSRQRLTGGRYIDL